MKVRKLMVGLSVLTFSALVLGACSSDNNKDSAASSASTTASSTTATSSSNAATTESSAPAKTAGADLQDGTYKLEEKNYSNGYRAVFAITVKDGKITESNGDYVNEAGKSKTEDTEYETNMKAKSGVGPAEFIPALNESLVATQSAGDVEVVTGATHTSESFQNYAQQLIQAAQAGKTDTIEIDNGADLKDGTYQLTEKNDSNGYHVDFAITVSGGKVTESNFDYKNADGKSKKDDTEYETNMKAKSGVGPAEFIPALNDSFLKAMGEEDGSAADVEVVTGATHSTHGFILYAQQLLNAAEKGDTTPIEVDNIVMSK
ncbi:extracellular electron transfer flavoprotein PplA [Enterococcus nangangensis]|uniref:extracellular electron transfer flavoprotein PplA n=1 Tax=Enterococcus nangangensis TaxID=2559926 RepID=UPI0010F65DDE|nr:extracellular electron transfer flavoprotein PplA [Enterococcus nangangensis]